LRHIRGLGHPKVRAFDMECDTMIPANIFLPRRLRRFLREEAGAITVDWVVLTAGVIAMVLMLFSILTPDLIQAVAETISNGVEGGAP